MPMCRVGAGGAGGWGKGGGSELRIVVGRGLVHVCLAVDSCLLTCCMFSVILLRVAEQDILLRQELDELAATHANFRWVLRCAVRRRLLLICPATFTHPLFRCWPDTTTTTTAPPPCPPVPPRSVYYVLNDPPKGWKGGQGFVTADMIK